MIRVAFVGTLLESSWMGGRNYLRNLIQALATAGSGKIDPVVITGANTSLGSVDDLPKIRIIRTRLLNWAGEGVELREFLQRWTGQRWLWAFLKANGVDALSHHTAYPYAGLDFEPHVPIVGWIPDFQFLRLPEYCDPAEREKRLQITKRACAVSSRLIVSSQDALNDLKKYFPETHPRARVLRFVASTFAGQQGTGLEELQKRYRFEGPYLHLPNQFWAHKNHAVVVEALTLLKRARRKVLVLSTGATEDHRNPEHFTRLKARLETEGLQDSFKILGRIPVQDVIGLMQGSAALINPSLFEGWSTTVEEGKAIGKPMLLSDIPVHREQAPERGEFFDPRDPAALAERMWRFSQNPPATESLEAIAAHNQARIAEFARTYEQIIQEAVGVK